MISLEKLHNRYLAICYFRCQKKNSELDSSKGRRTAFVSGTANEVRKDEGSESKAAGFFLQFDFLNGWKSYKSEIEICNRFRATNRQKRRQYILFITNEYLIVDIHLNPSRFYRDAFSS